MWREFPFIEAKGGEQCKTDEHGRQNVSTGPCILITTPLDSGHEQKETCNGQEATDEVNTLEDLAT